jgi:hypothetical protein
VGTADDDPSGSPPVDRRAETMALVRDWFRRVLIASVVFVVLVALGVVDLVRDALEWLTGWRPGG